MHRYLFHCSACGVTARPAGPTVVEALVLLRGFDWLVTPEPDPGISQGQYEVLCPVCRPADS